MRKLSVALLLALAATAVAAQPRVVTYEFDSGVVGAAHRDDELVLLFSNGTVAAYAMPHFKRLASISIAQETPPIGLGFLEGSALVVAFSNGTLAYLDLTSGRVVGAESTGLSGEAYKAAVGGRWVVLVQKYDFKAEKGSVKLDRLLVYDTKLKAFTLISDRRSGTLVYVFDVKIVGGLMLLEWIDTTCEICRLDDTFVTVYNLSSYKQVFTERFGECVADLDGRALVAVRVKDGRGFYKVLSSDQKWSFAITGRPLGVKVGEGVSYVLAQDPSAGEVVLYRVSGGAADRVSSVPPGERGYALSLIGGTPCVATPSYIAVGGLSFSVAPYPIPWLPRPLAEGANWAAVLYGRTLMSIVSTIEAEHVEVVVRTEPGAIVHVKELNATARADGAGFAILRVPPGAYTVSAGKEGYEENSTSIAVHPGNQRVDVVLTLREKIERRPPAKGFLNVTALGSKPILVEVVSESGATVARENVSESRILEIEPGRYQIFARVDGCEENFNATVASGQTLLVRVILNCSSEPRVERTVPPALNVSPLRDRLAALTQLQYQPPPTPLELPLVRDLDGGQVDLSRGVKLLVFFYTKCAGCHLLLPKLRGLDAEVVMIAPSIYDDEDALRSYAAEVNASGWTWVLDGEGRLIDLFNVSAFPTVVLLSNGRIEFIGVGAAGEAEQLAQSFLGGLQELVYVLRDPAVLAVIAGLALLAYLSRGGEPKQREV